MIDVDMTKWAADGLPETNAKWNIPHEPRAQRRLGVPDDMCSKRCDGDIGRYVSCEYASPAIHLAQRSVSICDEYSGRVGEHYRSRAHIVRAAGQSQNDDRSNGPCSYKERYSIEDESALARCLSQRAEVVDC